MNDPYRTPCFPRRFSPGRLLALGALLLLSYGAPAAAGASTDPRSYGEWLERLERAERSYGEEWSVLVQDLLTDEVILAYRPERRLLPASNRKIVTLALALDRYGPEHRFSTLLGLSPGGRTEDGWLTSSLVMRSAGDPSFSRKHLRDQNPAGYFQSWIAHLDTLGLTRFQGAFFIDASAFGPDQQSYPDYWDYNNRKQSFAAIPSAIAINGNVLELTAHPSTTRGNAGRVSVYPGGTGLRVLNQTMTMGGRKTGLEAEFSPDGTDLIVKGGLGQSVRTQVIELPLARPLDYLKAIAEEALEEEAITVQGGVHILTDPRQSAGITIERVVASHNSPPLPELLGIMMRDSDNFYAEQLWRAAAFRATGLGTQEAARRTEQEWLNRQGLAWIEPGYDGSGLSRMSRLSAEGQVAILRAILRSPYGPYLLHSLPASGKNGTLRGRNFGAKSGRVVAKTGTLTGVSALSGFIMDTENRPRWVFSLLGNAPRHTNGRLSLRQNQIMKLLIERLDGAGEVAVPEGTPIKRREGTLKQLVESPS